MKNWLNFLLIAATLAGMASCGYKGKVKSPQQIQTTDEKRARRADKDAEDALPSPDESPVPSPGVGANDQPKKAPKPAATAPTGTSAGRMSVIFNPAQSEGNQQQGGQ